MSVSLARTVRNAMKAGWKRYAKQMNSIGDARAGILVGTDDYGNEFYVSDDPVDIHLRTRWVEYKETKFWDVSQIEPGWHYWLGYGTDTLPTKVQGDEKTVRAYEIAPVHSVNLTGTTGAYVPYNTAKPKFQAWEPQVAERSG